MNFLRKIYDLVLKWSASKNAVYYLFAVAFIESSFFPIPPDIMLIPMILAAKDKAWRYAGIATIASVLGGYFGYAIGMFFFEIIAKPLIEFYHLMPQFEEFKSYYSQYGSWIVFGAGITPFPYKIITIASGAVSLNLTVFTIASVLARGLRFYIIAALLYKFGTPMKSFIEKNLGLLSILFFIALIAGFYAVKFLH